MPALAIEAEPVERAVGYLEIARRAERPAGGAPVDDVEHAAVADRREGLAGMMAHHPGDALGHARGKRPQRLPCLEIVIGIARRVTGVRLGMARGGLGHGQSLEDAIVALAQLRQRLDHVVFALRQRLRGFHRACEVAAVDRVEALVRRVERHRQRLRPPGVVERNVEVSLDAPLHVPVGLAMPDEADSGAEGSGDAMHVNVRKLSYTKHNVAQIMGWRRFSHQNNSSHVSCATSRARRFDTVKHI